MAFEFSIATREKLRLRMAISGVSGGGKTWTALAIGCRIAERLGGVPAVIDTEHSSARLYADQFKFAHLDLEPPFSPDRYIAALNAAVKAGFPVIIIDSLSHGWFAEGGVLDIVDNATAASPKKDAFGAGWRKGTPEQNKLVEAVLQAPAHVIATMRSKQAYEMDSQSHKVTKLGMEPIQRANIEYEFDITADMLLDHRMIISKTRMADLTDKVIGKPGVALADQILNWLDSGAEPVERAPQTFTPADTRPMQEAAAIPAKLNVADFADQARELGYPDALSIVKVLGATDGNTPKEALARWYDANGRVWEPALKILRNHRQITATPEPDADPEQAEFETIPASHGDPVDGKRGRR